jgi:enoyl-CoA hydratase/carnithine racemase
MDFQSLHLSVEGHVALLEFNHGKANEMGSAELAELEQLVRWLRENRQVTTLVTSSKKVSGRGTPIFVSGANVVERNEWSPGQVKTHVRWQRQVIASLRRVPVFHVAVVGGVALGWGTEFLLATDYRIGCDGALFALPETGLGIVPGAGGTAALWRHVGVAHALRLGMTGESIGPDEALRIGLIQERCGSLEDGLARARALAELVAKRSPTAIAGYKQAVLSMTTSLLEEELEARVYEHCVDTDNAAVGRSHFAAIRRGEDVPWPPRDDWGG